jgi:hypothetical protein
MEEAVQLVAKDQVNQTSQSQLSTQFAAQADAVKQNIQNLESKGDVHSAAELASQFEASLGAHQAVLQGIDGDMASAKSKIQGFERQINSEHVAVQDLRKGLENKIDSEDPQINATGSAGNVQNTDSTIKRLAQTKLNTASDSIAFMSSIISAQSNTNASGTVQKAEEMLKKANDFVAQAKEQINKGQYGHAFNLGNKAERITHQTKLFIDIQNKFHVHVENMNSTSSEQNNEDDSGTNTTSSVQSASSSSEATSSATAGHHGKNDSQDRKSSLERIRQDFRERMQKVRDMIDAVAL